MLHLSNKISRTTRYVRIIFIYPNIVNPSERKKALLPQNPLRQGWPTRILEQPAVPLLFAPAIFIVWQSSALKKRIGSPGILLSCPFEHRTKQRAWRAGFRRS
jgi:hypothetical protein